MSVTYSYSSATYNLARLSDELVTGGVTVVTIRGTTSAVDVVCADGTLQATVDAVVAAHVGTAFLAYPPLTGSATNYVRGDGTLAAPAAAAHASTHAEGGSDPIKVGVQTIPTAASLLIASGYSVVVSDEFEISSLNEVEIADTGVLEIVP